MPTCNYVVLYSIVILNLIIVSTITEFSGHIMPTCKYVVLYSIVILNLIIVSTITEISGHIMPTCNYVSLVFNSDTKSDNSF